MTWKVCDSMSQKLEFVELARADGANVSELCRRFSISRKTGYKWLNRVEQQGLEGLKNRSSRPLTMPVKTLDAIERLVLDVREQHPFWGGRKIKARLRALGHLGLPAPSTITEILRRHGKISEAASEARKADQRFERPTPNELWQIDFKGQFPMTNQQDCYPLTILDDHSRYVVCLSACTGPDHDTVKDRLRAVFQRYGMPQAMYSDNGPPWGSLNSLCGHTRLTAWLMRLDIKVIHGRPYHPQGRGKEERFHRTLKLELLQDRHFDDLPHAQSKFDPFRAMYNHERPHEALGLDVPASHYRMSQRAFSESLPEFEYPDRFERRRTNPMGQFQFKGRTVKTSEAFCSQTIGLAATRESHLWDAYFCHFRIGEFNLNDEHPRVRYQPQKAD